MATEKVCSLVTLSTELEDLHRAQDSAAEEHEKNMRIGRLRTKKKIAELAVKISAHEKLNLENEGAKARLLEVTKEKQRLMTMVKRQVELQEAQETKQIELIKKQKEERERFEVLLQKSYDFGTEWLELENEAAEKIAGLEEKLKDLEEDLEFQHDLVHTLTMSQRQLTDDVQATTSLVVRSNFFDESGTFDIRVKMLGELNTEGWYEACGHKFMCQEMFSEWVTKIDEKLRMPTFTPSLKSVPDGNNGKMKFAIDEDDKWLTKLRNKFGPIVANAVGTAALEIETWNSSGRYAVPVPWDYSKNKRATMSSIFQYLHIRLEFEQGLVKLHEEERLEFEQGLVKLHRELHEEERRSERESYNKLMSGLEAGMKDRVEEVVRKHVQAAYDCLAEEVVEKHKQLTIALQEKTKEVEEKDKQIKALTGAVSALTPARKKSRAT